MGAGWEGWGWGGRGSPRPRAWQTCLWKPARALLIKHNEAWDRKVFHPILGSPEGRANQGGLAKEKGLEGVLYGWFGGGMGTRLGAAAPKPLPRIRVGVLTGPPASLGRGSWLVTRDKSLAPLHLSFPTYKVKRGLNLNKKAPEPPPALTSSPPSNLHISKLLSGL